MNQETLIAYLNGATTPEQKKEVEKAIRRKALQNVATFVGLKVLIAITFHKLAKRAARYAETLDD